MNAVDVLHYVENYFDRNHNFFMLWGGLFAAIFFGLFVPYDMHYRTMVQLEQQMHANVLLESQIQELNSYLEVCYLFVI